MTLVLIGPACEDLIIIGDEESSKVGGASFFQSFVYEEFYDDYVAMVTASNADLIDEFPDKSKVKLILKDDTHHFINEYHDTEKKASPHETRKASLPAFVFLFPILFPNLISTFQFLFPSGIF